MELLKRNAYNQMEVIKHSKKTSYANTLSYVKA